jgi:Zn-dependent protease with chaperone function
VNPTAAGGDASGPAALYFDGSSARGRPVRLGLAAGELLATDEPADGTPGTCRRWPLARVQWPERTRHGARVVHLPDGGSLQAQDSTAFDAWRKAHGARESWVVRAQQNWRATTAAVLGLMLLVVAGYVWGVPWTARAVLLAVPPTVDEVVGRNVLASVESRWLAPSRLPAERQEALRRAFARLVQAGGPAPGYELRFASTEVLGPNAFALPGGTVVMTDELVALLDGHDETILGVLAHELGHVQHRHGMRALVQLSLVSAATAVALGDFSSVLAGAPALLAQMGYSRDAEREADAYAARLLRAAGVSPAVMVVLFEKLAPAQAAAQKTGPALRLPIALASHPADAERVQFFRDAAAGRIAP